MDASNFVCTVCDQNIDKKKYESHMKIHQNSNNFSRFKCSICHKHHIDSDELEKHIQFSHTQKHKKSKNDLVNKKICEYCGKMCGGRHLFTKHMRILPGEKPFACSICHRRFRQIHNIERHINTLHIKYKKYACNECREKFVRKVDLTSHQRKHTGKRPFECYICHKTFLEKGAFNAHMRTHEGKKTFECDICHKSFLLASHLKTHRKIHTGDKPYECVICHKRFLHKGTLMYHIRAHDTANSDKPFECGMCKMRFYYKNGLRKHMSTRHRDDLTFECAGCFRRYDCADKLITHIKRTCSKKCI